MDIMEAMKARHAVRSYQEKEIEGTAVQALQEEIDKCNGAGSLSIQLILNDDRVFKGLMAHYGGFRGVSNYIALVGPADGESEEKLGYYGEHLALMAQQLGLNTCWVAATYKKGKCRAVVRDGERLVCVLALGYGTTQGKPHKSKDMAQLCRANKDMPDWFLKGMEAAMLAPTAMNKQNFLITLNGENVTYEMKEGKYSKVDLGIVKYHFQNGAGLCN